MITSKNNRTVLLTVYLTALWIIANGVFVFGQVTASISGRIEDPSGASIPEANVIVTNTETQATRTMPSDAAGNYRVLSLPVGRYELRAEKTGFKASVQKGLTLVVGQEAVVNVKLEVGEVQQEVTVTGEAPLVNTTTASVSGLVGERQVKDLPLNGRSFDNLITLNAGAVSYTSMKNGPQAGTGEGNYFSVSGRRPLENLFLMNGVEYTGASTIGVTPGGVSGQLLGIDAVREFNVVSNAYSAEYGKRPGAQVSVVTQSGTNHLHGSAFEFLRNSVLDARNFYDQGTIPPFKRNQFGGSLGGPLRKDKTFIFGSYEGFRQRLGLSNLAFVPDNNARKGLQPDGTPFPGLNPSMLPYLAFWPLPNGRTLGQGIAESFSNPKQSIREDFGTTRLDQTIGSKDSLSAVYTLDDGDNITPLTDPLFGTITSLRSQVASIQETHIFSPQVINVFTAGFSRAGFLFNTPPLGPFPTNLSFVAGKAPGTLVIGGGTATNASTITSGGAANTAHAVIARNLFTYTDGIQIAHGIHQISAGVSFQWIRSNEADAARTNGQASFTTLASFMLGTVGTFTVVPKPTPLGWRSLEGAWYVQDNVQVRPNLTLRIGLRHEFTNGWNEVHGRAANYDTDANGVLLTNTIVGTSPLSKNNATRLFSPRIGLAWDPFGKGKTSVRAGFGFYYSLHDGIGFILKDVAPFNGTLSYQNLPLLPLLPINASVPLAPICGPAVPAPCSTFQPSGIQRNLQTPTVHAWDFTVEHQLTKDTALRVAYVGSSGNHQLINVDPNSIGTQICANPTGCPSGGILAAASRDTVPQGAEYIPVGIRPNPFISNGFFWFSEGNTSYNALQTELIRRLSRGLQFRANYTWSKNLDMGSGLSASQSINQPQMLLDRLSPGRDKGPSALNIQHQASGSFSYELPFGRGQHWFNNASGAAGKLVAGWQLNGILTLLSGFPLTPQVGSNRSGDGNARNPDRPSVNPAFNGRKIPGTPDKWFDPAAYLLPKAGTYGNLGRGVLEGPGLTTLDFSAFKSTSISERLGLQFRAEFFNILNHTNFGTPNPIVFTGNNINSTAGVISTTTTNSRQIQFGLKLIF